MAIDEALLAEAVDGGPATLRLYQWDEPTLSLGYFQRYDDRHHHAASNTCAIVRRQSGGGAILHDRELTYSLTLPPSHPLARDATALYNDMHDAFVVLLTSRLPSTQSRWRLALHGKHTCLLPSQEPFLCFERRSCGDLLLIDSDDSAATISVPSTYKIMGSAQRRHCGAILQHGSLLIARSSATPDLLGWNDLTGQPLAFDDLVSGVVRQLFGLVGVAQEPAEMPTAIRIAARKIEQQKYSARSWTTRR